MKSRHFILPTAAAVALGASILTPPGKRIAEDVRGFMAELLTTASEKERKLASMIQPTENDKKAAKAYYASRTDLTLTDTERDSLEVSHARLAFFARGLENGTFTVEDLNIIFSSEYGIITNKNTKLQVDNTEGIGYCTSIAVNKKNIEFSTADGAPNIILENPTVSKVEMVGGELRVNVNGDLYETQVTDSTAKQKAFSSDFSPRDGTRPFTWNTALRLVLAK